MKFTQLDLELKGIYFSAEPCIFQFQPLAINFRQFPNNSLNSLIVPRPTLKITNTAMSALQKPGYLGSLLDHRKKPVGLEGDHGAKIWEKKVVVEISMVRYPPKNWCMQNACSMPNMTLWGGTFQRYFVDVFPKCLFRCCVCLFVLEL